MAIYTRRFRHPALRGALLALLAALTVAGAADALGTHSCPHHDRLPAGRSDGAGDHASPHEGFHAGHDAEAEHDGHDPCTCMGGACSAAALALPSLSGGDLRPPATVRRDSELPLPEARRAVRKPYLLPFANAPPTA